MAAANPEEVMDEDVGEEQQQHQGENRLDPSQIPIRSQADVHSFMDSIHKDFLQFVEPSQCGDLMDLMKQEELLASSDIESLSEKHGSKIRRKDQARDLWFLLRSQPPEGFKATVLPFLCKRYPHIIPPSWTPVGTPPRTDCLRHHIEGTVRHKAMIDMLYSSDCIDCNQYRTMIDKARTSWDELFHFLCQPRSDDVASPLMAQLRDLLIRYKLSVPDDLPDLVSHGLPCTCLQGRHTVSPGAPELHAGDMQVSNWILRNDPDILSQRAESLSSLGYPRDDISSVSTMDTLTPPRHRQKKN